MIHIARSLTLRVRQTIRDGKEADIPLYRGSIGDKLFWACCEMTVDPAVLYVDAVFFEAPKAQ